MVTCIFISILAVYCNVRPEESWEWTALHPNSETEFHLRWANSGTKTGKCCRNRHNLLVLPQLMAAPHAQVCLQIDGWRGGREGGAAAGYTHLEGQISTALRVLKKTWNFDLIYFMIFGCICVRCTHTPLLGYRCTDVYTRAHTGTNMPQHVDTHVHAQTYSPLHTSTHKHKQKHTHTRTRTHRHRRTHACTYTHARAHTYRHSDTDNRHRHRHRHRHRQTQIYTETQTQTAT